jgi:hypothetical protein
MEVHPPHKPIHSVKEFMIHLLAITIGLLIALGLESSVEWLHHRHQARDARENIYQEIRVNQQDIARQLNALPGEETRLDQLLGLVDDLQNSRSQKTLGDFKWTAVILRDSAWNAASSTGAVAFMDYSEVKQYSQLYDMQKFYGSTMERNLEGRHELNVSLMRLLAPGKHTDAEFESVRRIILSQKLREMEFRELDNTLNVLYNRILPQEN